MSDYKERMAEEYWATKMRYEKLKWFNTQLEAHEMMPNEVPQMKHDCPLSLLREQQKHMGEYLHVLQLRAIIECVDLSKRPKDWCN